MLRKYKTGSGSRH